MVWTCCIDNACNEHVLVLGKTYTVAYVNNLSGICRLDRIPYDWFMSRFILASDIESSATPTEQVVGISQNEYDEMYDRIELLESLLRMLIIGLLTLNIPLMYVTIH